jgi:hypothetical protein
MAEFLSDEERMTRLLFWPATIHLVRSTDARIP